MLPRGPQWKCKPWPTSHPTKQPINLYFRDAIECLSSLFGSPLFADYLQYSPFRVFKTAEKLVRIYEDWMSGNVAWDMQVHQLRSYYPPALTLLKGPITGRCNSTWHHTLIG